ncbi:membrane protein [Clostridia bacterium]|nr:membrane protein [Clostridia bacterium]
MLPFAVTAITAALLFYSVGVWAERVKKLLKTWHVAVFWLGFVCDCVGTSLMSAIASSGEGAANPLHAISGVAALALMLFHAVWATVVIARKQENMQRHFHKFSLVVWLIWLIPYFSGMVMGMSR